MKIAIVTDVNSSITNEEADRLGIYLLPMPFSIDDVEYLAGIDLDENSFYEKQISGSDIYTSQPSPASVIEIWEKALRDNDAIIHIPMSSSLSTSYETAMMLSKEEEFEGKVFVVDNKRVSITQRSSVLEALKMVALLKTPAQIVDYLEKNAYEQSIYITVDTLKYLKKGGRITAAAAALGTLLKIKPVLSLQGGKLDSMAKARTMKQAKQMMISYLKNDLFEKFNDENAINSEIYIVHANDKEAAIEFAKEAKEAFPEYKKDIEIFDLSLSVATHVGSKTLAIACVKRGEYLGD